MIEYGKEARQRNNQISALLNESLLTDLIKEKEKRRLTPKEKEFLERVLNERDITGNPIWRASPPKNNIEEGG
jgi:hypothetical protein